MRFGLTETQRKTKQLYWLNTVGAAKVYNATQGLKRFALFPTRMTDGRIVWLEYYKKTYVSWYYGFKSSLSLEEVLVYELSRMEWRTGSWTKEVTDD